MWMWAVVPSEPLCLHTQSLATAKNMQEYASAQRMIILFLRGLHEGRSENTNQVKSEKRWCMQLLNQNRISTKAHGPEKVVLLQSQQKRMMDFLLSAMQRQALDDGIFGESQACYGHTNRGTGVCFNL
eukprot:TRINITY_DN50_c0_g1_i21.p1 TRINITY_DN50_c0_g1~~TRINITY_DN50_c0_g1_i21.p1  ORF type:complete len:128 (+),score=7.31 TRINITY_DN50_c0_g1_i21:67-450(+)